MGNIETLDVTVLESRVKHTILFGKIDALKAGDSLIIHNDHDPVPLGYKLKAEYPDQFTWEYLMSGPEIWEVKITRKGADSNDLTIGEIVAKDHRKADVFSKFGIDFCCGGKTSLPAACEKAGVQIAIVETELNKLNNIPLPASLDFDNMKLGLLVDYIMETHHTFVNENMRPLVGYTRKIADVHGNHYPELLEIADIFQNVASELELHLRKEEDILFPLIIDLAGGDCGASEDSCFSEIGGPIYAMENEHETVGEAFHTIARLSNNYTVPADGCSTYEITYKKLKEFEEDLHRHIHLENNILFPKALKLAENMNQ